MTYQGLSWAIPRYDPRHVDRSGRSTLTWNAGFGSLVMSRFVIANLLPERFGDIGPTNRFWNTLCSPPTENVVPKEENIPAGYPVRAHILKTFRTRLESFLMSRRLSGLPSHHIWMLQRMCGQIWKDDTGRNRGFFWALDDSLPRRIRAMIRTRVMWTKYFVHLFDFYFKSGLFFLIWF